MTHLARHTTDVASVTQGAADAQGSLCRRGSLALLTLRAKYGVVADVAAMDPITALRAAATLEFLSNNLPDTL